MEIVIVIIMLLVGFNFVLKLTYHNLLGKLLTCAVAALFVGLMWEEATTQSKTQISDWLNRPELMLDTSVLLTVDVFFQVAFCVMMAKKLANERFTRVDSVIYTVTLWFPGLLIFPTLFALLVEIIFSFPGTDFATLAWCTAAAVMILAPAIIFGIKWLLPENDLRLELMFMINALTAILGVIATVNGRTAVKGTNSVEWDALLGILAILSIGTIAGLLINKRKTSKLISHIK
ncbi:MAG: hypothetical protein HFJ95_09070 [Muribaculaceae bacterium]|nr:hypothetical protein [Muribaculaceae bacterium]